jgi:protein-tyrosine-phosphatase
MKLILFVCFGLIGCTKDAASPAESVVFVCEHGAAKSVVASEYFNKLAAERGLAIRAIARGADPQANLSVSALAGLQGDGISPALGAPRSVSASELRSSRRVVAFDCEQPAMKALKGMDACWDDVPTVGDDYARARDSIRAHVAEMLDQIVAQSRS